MVLICISQVTNDVDDIYMCLLAIWISFLEKSLFGYFAHFKIGLFVFLFLSCKRSLYILDTRCMICKYFIPFCGLSFYFLDGVLWSTKVLNCDESNVPLFSFFAHAFGVISKNFFCQILGHENLPLCFLLISYIYILLIAISWIGISS